jgi:hypothetical protein
MSQADASKGNLRTRGNFKVSGKVSYYAEVRKHFSSSAADSSLLPVAQR